MVAHTSHYNPFLPPMVFFTLPPLPTLLNIMVFPNVVTTTLLNWPHLTLPCPYAYITFLPHAFSTIAYFINHMPKVDLSMQSSFEKLFKSTPNYTKLKVFGCLFIHGSNLMDPTNLFPNIYLAFFLVIIPLKMLINVMLLLPKKSSSHAMTISLSQFFIFFIILQIFPDQPITPSKIRPK